MSLKLESVDKGSSGCGHSCPSLDLIPLGIIIKGSAFNQNLARML